MEIVGEKCKQPLTCPMCDTGEVENARHFACSCPAYDELRAECLQRIGQVLGDEAAPILRQAMADRSVHLFLGDKAFVGLPAPIWKAADQVVCNYLKLAWRKRQDRWRQLCVPGDDWTLK